MQVTSIIVDDTEGLYLEREARKWATEVAKMSKLSESINKQIMDYQSNTNPLQVSVSHIVQMGSLQLTDKMFRRPQAFQDGPPPLYICGLWIPYGMNHRKLQTVGSFVCSVMWRNIFVCNVTVGSFVHPIDYVYTYLQ